MATDIGHIFEKELEKVWRHLADSHLLAWHRLSDTRSAGGSIVGEQPSDYIVGLPARSRSPLDGQRLLFVEAKASESKESLTRGAMRPSQRGAVARYRMVLSLPYLVFFWDALCGVIQVWDGAAVHGTERLKATSPHKLAEWESVGAGVRLDTAKVAGHLARFFELPDRAETLAFFNNR